MKPLWSIIKIVLLAALLIGAFFGYRFFKVWQENERPTVTFTEWENAETTLGSSATLLVTLDVPWHREFSTATPTSHPDGFLPVRHETALQKGQLNLNGTREWKLRIPLVATAAALPEGQTLSIPLKSTERLSCCRHRHYWAGGRLIVNAIIDDAKIEIVIRRKQSIYRHHGEIVFAIGRAAGWVIDVLTTLNAGS